MINDDWFAGVAGVIPRWIAKVDKIAITVSKIKKKNTERMNVLAIKDTLNTFFTISFFDIYSIKDIKDIKTREKLKIVLVLLVHATRIICVAKKIKVAMNICLIYKDKFLYNNVMTSQ